MRYLIIISLCGLLGSCDHIGEVKAAGAKVAKTINACTEATKNVCKEAKASVSDKPKKERGGADAKASIVWDTRMMLW